MQAAGARLTGEVLTTGEVLLTIEEPELGDFDIRAVCNGPEVHRAIEEMLRAFDTAKYAAWKAEMNEVDA